MASPEIDGHGNPGQTCWLKNNGGRITIRENTLLKILQAFQSAVEAEAVAGLGLLVQATNLMATGTAEIDTNTPDQCRLLLKIFGFSEYWPCPPPMLASLIRGFFL
jgi:hypothetical protein